MRGSMCDVRYEFYSRTRFQNRTNRANSISFSPFPSICVNHVLVVLTGELNNTRFIHIFCRFYGDSM